MHQIMSGGNNTDCIHGYSEPPPLHLQLTQKGNSQWTTPTLASVCPLYSQLKFYLMECISNSEVKTGSLL